MKKQNLSKIQDTLVLHHQETVNTHKLPILKTQGEFNSLKATFLDINLEYSKME